MLMHFSRAKAKLSDGYFPKPNSLYPDKPRFDNEGGFIKMRSCQTEKPFWLQMIPRRMPLF